MNIIIAYLRPRLHAQRGQALVEFAFAASLILTFLIGIIDFGIALFDYDSVAHAARHATRYAVVNASSYCTVVSACAEFSATMKPNIENAANRAATGISGIAYSYAFPASLGCTPSGSVTIPNLSPQCAIQIKATYTFHHFLPLANSNLSSTSQLVFTN